MLIATDKKGNQARIQFSPSNDRKEHWLITFAFKNTSQTNWQMSEEDAKALVQQIMGSVEWSEKEENIEQNT